MQYATQMRVLTIILTEEINCLLELVITNLSSSPLSSLDLCILKSSHPAFPPGHRLPVATAAEQHLISPEVRHSFMHGI